MLQEEDFEEDDAIYDELNLDEQDAAFGKVNGEDEEDASGSDDDGALDCAFSILHYNTYRNSCPAEPQPQRSPVKESRKSTREDKKKDDEVRHIPF